MIYFLIILNSVVWFFAGKYAEKAYWHKYVNNGQLRHISGQRWEKGYGK